MTGERDRRIRDGGEAAPDGQEPSTLYTPASTRGQPTRFRDVTQPILRTGQALTNATRIFSAHNRKPFSRATATPR